MVLEISVLNILKVFNCYYFASWHSAKKSHICMNCHLRDSLLHFTDLLALEILAEPALQFVVDLVTNPSGIIGNLWSFRNIYTVNFRGTRNEGDLIRGSYL